MIKYNNRDIAKFLAFTIWANTDFISISDLKGIKLQDNSLESLWFFKNKIINIFNEEIDSYNLANWDNIWLLLSWWLDSTLLLFLLKNKFPKSKIFTYTLWYTKEDEHLSISRKIAESYWAEHREIIYNLEDNLFSTFDDIYSSGYELEWEDSLIMNHILAKEVKKDCKVVFSWFGLDYVFWWMDLFRNSFIEKLYNENLINKKFILKALNGNKFYLKYVLNKIKLYDEDFFIKFGEYYWWALNTELEDYVKDHFYSTMSNFSNLPTLKKQIYFIILTSLANRYRPYNLPYEKQWLKHYNPFWSLNVIKKVLELNIDVKYLLNPYTLEKKYIIREIFKDLWGSELIENLHRWTVLKYNKAIEKNKTEIYDLLMENKDFLLQYLSKDYFNVIDRVINDSIWYENSKQIILLLQLLFHEKHNENIVTNNKIPSKELIECI